MELPAGVKLYDKDIWRTIVICPTCGEDNSDNFRFCGMCGTLLEARRPAGAPVPSLQSAVPPPVPATMANAPEPLRPPVMENATKPVQPISGPSMLGLNQPDANQSRSNLMSPNLPSMDLLRETAFSGLDSFFEPERPKGGGRRILLMVALLAALGGAGWWTYTNYLGAGESRKPEVATSSTGEASTEKPSTKAAAPAADPALDAGSSQAAVPPAAVPGDRVPEGQAENRTAGPDAAKNTANAEAKPVSSAPVTPARTALTDKRAAKREPSVTSAKASSSHAPALADTGDAAFRKGEAYLYGRAVPENCDEAVKNLKAASAKSNARARSAFGTMYATGHCVPRDLPTSYLWFALALRVDPNNQILEKDLSAVWNQMTPPERQMATRMKQ